MFLQIKDTKHNKWDFCSDAWVMPQGWDLGGPDGHKIYFSEYGHVAYQIDGDDD